jgi:cobalt/nickel transport system permease protein
MHISDGVLSAPVWIGGYVLTAGIVAVTMKKARVEQMPKVAVVTSSFFVASLIHIPIGPTSVHLILNGLVGMILGPLAYVSILLGLTLQALLFQHGGITTIGCNTVMMGVPALLGWKIFGLRKIIKFKSGEAIFGFLTGFLAVFFATLILATLLITTGTEFIGVAKYAALAHLPVMFIEGVVTGFVASFLMKVKPEILERM